MYNPQNFQYKVPKMFNISQDLINPQEPIKLKPQPDFLIFDFETLSHRPQEAIVVSFGAIAGRWTDDIHDLRANGFYTVIDAKSQKEYGLKHSTETMEWWKKQSEEVQSILFQEGLNIKDVLLAFNEWCSNKGVDQKTQVWIRAPHFDYTLIYNLYVKVLGTETLPFSHWKVRDSRTACGILYKSKNGYAPGSNEVFKREGIVQHNALEDSLKDFLQLRPYFLKDVKNV